MKERKKGKKLKKRARHAYRERPDVAREAKKGESERVRGRERERVRGGESLTDARTRANKESKESCFVHNNVTSHAGSWTWTWLVNSTPCCYVLDAGDKLDGWMDE